MKMKKLPAVILCCLLSLSAMAELRLALIPLDQASKSMADLALAELSNDDGLAFLERTEIAAIEKEINLSSILSDFVPRPSLMENTQLFILLKQSQLIGFDSTTGVRLKDCPIATQQDLVNAVRDAVAKQRNFSGDVLYKLSAMPLVPIHLSEAQKKLARKVEDTFLQLLCNKKDVVLLERRHLLYLLNEPNAQENGLTDKLFAGTNILKPSATSDGKNGIVLKLLFFSPDGKTQIGEAQATFAKSETVAEDCRKFLESLTLPAAMKEDKHGEARDFIDEAWFAIKHGLSTDAVASGTSAFALDKEYEIELSRIAFHSVPQIIGKSQNRRDSTLTAKDLEVALANMRLATALAEKHGGFTREGTFFASQALLCMGFYQLAGLPDNQKDVARNLTERCILLRKKQLDKELLALADSPGPRWPDAVFKLETRSWYVYELDLFCNLPWDYSWWQQLVYPALEKLIAECKEYQPELERFSAMDFKDIHPIVSNPKIKALRYAINRQMGFLRFQYLLNFNRVFETISLTPENRKIYQQAHELMLTSNIPDLAVHGLNGLNILHIQHNERQRRENAIAMIMHGQKKELENGMKQGLQKDQAFYYEQLLRLVENGAKIKTSMEQHLAGGIQDDSEFLEQKLAILDIAIPKYNSYQLFANSLLVGCEKWLPKRAQMVYDKLLAFEAESQKIFEAASRPNTLRITRMKDYFQNQRKKLEKAFDIKPAVADTTPVESPYAEIYSPLENRQKNYGMAFVGYENKAFYVMNIEYPNAFLLKIDVQNNMRLSEIATIKMPGLYGGMRFGAILDDYYAASDGRMVYLFPKNGSKPEIIDFGDYCKVWCNCMAGCGERLFFTFDGRENAPGTLLEYNVQTREKKLLASTVDRSVKWPLQGIGRPYYMHQILCDPANDRILLLLHETPPPENRTTYSVKLWAYYWKTGKWNALSNYLPFNEPNTEQMTLIDGTIWLNSDFGYGKINNEGNFQPLYLIGGNGHLSDTPILYGGDSFKQVVLDLSQVMKANPLYDDLQRFDLNLTVFSGKILLGEKVAMIPKEHRFMRLPEPFRPIACFDGKYCVGYKYFSNGFQIRTLKDYGK